MSFLYWNISLVLCFCCVYMAAGENSGELPPPVDAKILWVTRFCPTLNWTRPHVSEKCVVNYTIEKRESGQQSPGRGVKTSKTNYVHPCMSREKDVTFIITTVPENCPNRSKSKPVTLHLHSLAEDVKDFRLVYYTHQTVNWTWQPVDTIKNLQSYYWFRGSDPPMSALERCPQGIFRGLQLIGCHVNRSTSTWPAGATDVYILVNGTRGSDVINATFHRRLKDSFKPRPPEVSVGLKEPNQLLINFTKPDFLNVDHCFGYQVNYTECGELKSERVDGGDGVYSVSYNSECQYSVWVRSTVRRECGSGGSDPSQREDYGSASCCSLWVVLVVVCVCVLLWICALLFFFYKYKERLLPKIPEPHLDSFKGLMERLYVPAPERVEISLELCPSNTDVAQHTT